MTLFGYFLCILLGVVIGMIIMGLMVVSKEPEEDTNSIKAMKDYIYELEQNNQDLTESNRRLKETIIRGGYQ